MTGVEQMTKYEWKRKGKRRRRRRKMMDVHPSCVWCVLTAVPAAGMGACGEE